MPSTDSASKDGGEIGISRRYYSRQGILEHSLPVRNRTVVTVVRFVDFLRLRVDVARIKALLYTVKLFVKGYLGVPGCRPRVNSYLELIMHLFGTRPLAKHGLHTTAITLPRLPLDSRGK